MFPSSPYNSQRSLFSPPPRPHKQQQQRPRQSSLSQTHQQPISFHGAAPSRQNDAISSQFSTSRVTSLFATLRLAPDQPPLVPAPNARSPYTTDRVLAGRAVDASRTDSAVPKPTIATARAQPGYAPLDPQAALGLEAGRGAKRRFNKLRELRARRAAEGDLARRGRVREWEEEKRLKEERLREERRREKVGRQRVAFASDSVLGTDIETGAPVPYAPRVEGPHSEPVLVGYPGYPGWGAEEVMVNEKGMPAHEENGEGRQAPASYASDYVLGPETMMYPAV